jgi:holliday junction DNA helicase RuvA
MIAFLRGNLLHLDDASALIDVQGVGYEVFCSMNTLSDLQVSLKQKVELWVHTHVREDAMDLFGFPTLSEKQFFLSLIKINGVGPKTALNILSGSRIENIMEMVETGDVKGLSKLPKVGKKTAEQMILALKGKLVLGENKLTMPAFIGNKKEILSALVNLGFRIQDVEKVIDGLPKDIATEEGVRRGLQTLSGVL